MRATRSRLRSPAGLVNEAHPWQIARPVDKVVKLGAPIFALAVAALGAQQLLYVDFVPGPLIAPPWLPWRPLWACLIGLALLFAGAGILVRRKVRQTAFWLSLAFLLVLLFFHLPAPSAVLRDGVARTRAFEALALWAAAWIIAGAPPVQLGRLTFAACLAVFGIQHFMYAPFVASVVPAWIPGALLWTYFTGVAFLAAALAIVVDQQARLAAALVGLMLLLWVVVLHAPRVAAKLAEGNEWNSLLVAMALGGGAWALAAAPPVGRTSTRGA
jgi:uncharacterized membrane protein